MKVPAWVPPEILQGPPRDSLSPSQLLLLSSVIPPLLDAISKIGTLLRESSPPSSSSASASASASRTGTTNAFGDEQLQIDLAADSILRSAIHSCPHIVTASSEEDPVERAVHISTAPVSGVAVYPSSIPADPPAPRPAEQFSVAFDPLDGSSVVSADWSVGTIIGIWQGQSALGQCPDDGMVASILGVYGPRTTAFLALREPGQRGFCMHLALSSSSSSSSSSTTTTSTTTTTAATSSSSSSLLTTTTTPATAAPAPAAPQPLLLNPSVRLANPPFQTRYFAPANLRAAADDPTYASLISAFISRRYTLRYSGALVPDVAHILAKGHGIYLSPVAPRSRSKLRRLYELCPVALVVECAGGLAVDSEVGATGRRGERVLARVVRGCDERGGVYLGTPEEVAQIMAVLNVESSHRDYAYDL